MMVDEQLPMQRKILKGQVAARNEETNVGVRSEINKKCVLVWLLYYSRVGYFCFVTQQVKFAGDMARSNEDKMQWRVKVLKMASWEQVY